MSPAVQTPAFAQWLAGARQAAQQPPAQPRTPLVVACHEVGSVAPGVLDEIGLQRFLDKRYKLSFQEQSGTFAWQLPVPDAEVTSASGTGKCQAKAPFRS